MIKINNLKKSYGPFQALDQINLSISQNQITGLMGKNGSGKSTFIKCLLNEVSDEPTLGLDTPSMAILKKALRIIAKKETTLIVTSHEPYFMQGLCNSIYILDKGRFIYENDSFNDSTLSLADLYLDLIDPHLKSRIDTVLVNF